MAKYINTKVADLNVQRFIRICIETRLKELWNKLYLPGIK